MRRLSASCFMPIVAVIVICTGSMLLPNTAIAATPIPTTISIQPTPPPSIAPDLLITSLVGSSLPDYFELYNQSDSAFSLDGWQITFTIHDANQAGCANIGASVPLPANWLLPKKYLTLQRTAAPVPGSLTIPFTLDSSLLTGCVTPQLSSVSLIHGTDDPEQVITIPANEWLGTSTTVAQHKQRANSPGSSRMVTGTFDSDYKIVTGAITLNSDPLYTPPADAAGLQILELLPNPHSCSPLDTDPTCADYIKLYNPTDQPIDLAAYRLRVGYKGQDESVTNTFTWGKDIDPANDELIMLPEQYFMLNTRNDGQPLSLTDTGNYIWLEDAYGAAKYEPIVAYPDASSTTKMGYAWAYDGTSWNWSSAPQPSAPNYFPPAPVIVPATPTVTVSVLAPCDPGEYRNPDTNRCKSLIIASSASLTPCNVGEERNPETNRCRSIVAVSTSLTSCDPGWERNLDTNRCRKIVAPVVAGAATAKVNDIAAPSSNRTGWLVAGIAIAAALAYAVYEWRQDIMLVTEKIKAKGRQHIPKRWRNRK